MSKVYVVLISGILLFSIFIGEYTCYRQKDWQLVASINTVDESFTASFFWKFEPPSWRTIEGKVVVMSKAGDKVFEKRYQDFVGEVQETELKWTDENDLLISGVRGDEIVKLDFIKKSQFKD